MIRSLVLFTVLALTPLFWLDAQELPLLRGEVQDLKEGAVSINIGAQQGVTAGMIFNAYGGDEVLTVPLTDEVIVKRGRIVGRLRVVHVAPRFCRCEMVEPFKAELGMVVIGRPVREIGNRPPVIETVTWDGTASWGRPFRVRVEARDPEGAPLQLTGSSDRGRLSTPSLEEIIWFPPRGDGKGVLDISVTDGIGRDSRRLEFSHVAPGPLRYRPTPWDRLLGGDLPVDRIDQIQASTDGLLWLLDRSARKLVSVNHDLRVVNRIDLEGTTPSRFSVGRQRVVVLDDRSERVLVYTRAGKPLARFGGSGSEIHEWEEAVDVILLDDESVAVLDGEQQTVRVYDREGRFRACVGHPGNKPPGFLKARWLSSLGKRGFAVIDADQHSRVLFDLDLRYVESLPLGDLQQPVGGPDAVEPSRWPSGFDRKGLTTLTAVPGTGWAGVDDSGHRLWLWGTEAGHDRHVTLRRDLEATRLRQRPDGTVQLLFQSPLRLVTVDSSGWRRAAPVPAGLDEATDVLPVGDGVWLDGENHRIRAGQVRFGQRGSGAGMLDEPTSLVSWDNSLAVLDVENEKVALFTAAGKLVREQEFEDCRSFCVDDRGHLIVQGRGGQYWTWAPGGAAPTPLKGPEGRGLARVSGGFAVIGNDTILVCDTSLKVLQEIPAEGAHDVLEDNDGLLWLLSSTGLVRLVRE